MCGGAFGRPRVIRVIRVTRVTPPSAPFQSCSSFAQEHTILRATRITAPRLFFLSSRLTLTNCGVFLEPSHPPMSDGANRAHVYLRGLRFSIVYRVLYDKSIQVFEGRATTRHRRAVAEKQKKHSVREN